jgi:hypothetical protein
VYFRLDTAQALVLKLTAGSAHSQEMRDRDVDVYSLLSDSSASCRILDAVDAAHVMDAVSELED